MPAGTYRTLAMLAGEYQIPRKLCLRAVCSRLGSGRRRRLVMWAVAVAWAAVARGTSVVKESWGVIASWESSIKHAHAII